MSEQHQEIEFKWADAWLLCAIWGAGEYGKRPASLKAVIGMGDGLNHAIFTNSELRNGFARLTAAGYVQDEQGSFSLRGEARQFMQKDGAVGTVSWFDRTAFFLGASPYDGKIEPEDPRWPYPSLTDKAITQADKEYSKEFWKASRERDEKTRSPLANAYLGKDIPKLKALIEGGADVDARDQDGMTVLMHASGKANLEIVRYLMEKGARLDPKDQQGDTVLHHAARRDSVDLVRYLVDQGAEVDARDRWGGTPLWVAVKCSKGKGEVIRYLLSKGADRHLMGALDKSPLELARSRKDVDLLPFFEGD